MGTTSARKREPPCTLRSTKRTRTPAVSLCAVNGREQRRVLMPKTAHHVYQRVDSDQVVILAVWGARRQRSPRCRRDSR
jgi:hypothetical protein